MFTKHNQIKVEVKLKICLAVDQNFCLWPSFLSFQKYLSGSDIEQMNRIIRLAAHSLKVSPVCLTVNVNMQSPLKSGTSCYKMTMLTTAPLCQFLLNVSQAFTKCSCLSSVYYGQHNMSVQLEILSFSAQYHYETFPYWMILHLKIHVQYQHSLPI